MGEVDPSTLIICICSIVSDDGFTIQCDCCLTWQHAVCVQVAPDRVPEQYLCHACDPLAAMQRGVDKGKAELIQKKRIAEEGDDDRDEPVVTTYDDYNIPTATIPRVKPAAPSRSRAKPSLGSFSLANSATPSPAVVSIPLAPVSVSNLAVKTLPESTAAELGGGQDDSAYAIWEYEFTPIESNLWTDKALLRRVEGCLDAMSNVPASKLKSRARPVSSTLPSTTSSVLPSDTLSTYLNNSIPIRMNKLPAPLHLVVKPLSREAFKVINPTSTTYLSASSSSVPSLPTPPPVVNSYLSSMTPTSSTSTLPPLCPFPRPTAHALFANTNAAIPAGAFITALNGEITSLERYKQTGINQYPLLGVPKAGVRLVSLAAPAGAGMINDIKGKGREEPQEIVMVVDQRQWGDRVRFARSGCHPNAIVRVVLLTSKSKVMVNEQERNWRAQRDGGAEELASTLVFALYATREIGRREEIVLPWDWDDRHIVHSLPFLLDPTSASSTSTTSLDPTTSSSLPPNIASTDLQPLAKKMSDVTTTLLGVMTCACAGSLPSSVSTGVADGDCAIHWMCKAASLALSESSSFTTNEKRSRSSAKMLGIKSTGQGRREPFATLLVNTLSAATTTELVSVLRKPTMTGTGGRKQGATTTVAMKRKPNLGPLVGFDRSWKDDFEVVQEEQEEEPDEITMKTLAVTNSMDLLLGFADSLPLSTPLLPRTTASTSISTLLNTNESDNERAADSDESELTEPLSHLSSSEDEGKPRSSAPLRRTISSVSVTHSSTSKKRVVVKQEEKMDIDSRSSAVSESSPLPAPAPVVVVRPKKKVRDRAGEKVRRLERERLAAVAAEEVREAKRVLEKEKRDVAAAAAAEIAAIAAAQDKSKKRKKVIYTSSISGSSSEEEKEAERAPKRKRSTTLTSTDAIPKSSFTAPSKSDGMEMSKREQNKSRRSKSPAASRMDKPTTANPQPPSPSLTRPPLSEPAQVVVIIPSVPLPPPPPPPAPPSSIGTEPAREPTPPPPPPPRVRLSLAAYRERQAANKLAEIAAALAAPPALSPEPVVPSVESSSVLTPVVASAVLSSTTLLSPPLILSPPPLSPARVTESPLPPTVTIPASATTPALDFNIAEDVLKSIGDYFAREALSASTASTPLSILPPAPPVIPIVDLDERAHRAADTYRYTSPEVIERSQVRSPFYTSSFDDSRRRVEGNGYEMPTQRSPGRRNGLGLDTALSPSSTLTSSYPSQRRPSHSYSGQYNSIESTMLTSTTTTTTAAAPPTLSTTPDAQRDLPLPAFSRPPPTSPAALVSVSAYPSSSTSSSSRGGMNIHPSRKGSFGGPSLPRGGGGAGASSSGGTSRNAWPERFEGVPSGPKLSSSTPSGPSGFRSDRGRGRGGGGGRGNHGGHPYADRWGRRGG